METRFTGWMKMTLGFLGFWCAGAALAADTAVEVRVRPTPTGPRIFVDGKPVRPRFYYGSPACLTSISFTYKRTFIVPFRAEADTSRGRVELNGFDGDDPMWFSDATLIDKTTSTTNVIQKPGEWRTRHFFVDNLPLVKGHLYWLSVRHRAAHFRTYFNHEASYTTDDGRKVVLPMPYGDTLGDTVRLAADADVDLVTFSTDESWGSRDWWMPPGEEAAYDKIDRECARLIALNPNVLLVPRVKADAPPWLLARDPSLKMKFARGFTVEMSSVSSRAYRRAACEQIEKMTRHLRAKFPRNFAGLHISGQNSAEWFYMMSQTKDLSGYDVATRDAFRVWLAARGEKDAATAEVPTAEDRMRRLPGFRRDDVRDRRALDFAQFRQEEIASFISELGAAIRRGSEGKSLALFFYGYAWELGAVPAGPAETGHYGLDWLLRNGRENVDGLSAPISYGLRTWPGAMSLMSAAETIGRKGILWINEDDNRTHHEDFWDHIVVTPHDDPVQTRNVFLCDSAVQILQGYGDWWMDLFGRGWFRDPEIWDVRRALNALDDAMLKRTRPYEPNIAAVVDEGCMLHYGWGAAEVTRPRLNRRGLATCGTTYGQYLLNDVLDNPPPAKVFYLLFTEDATPEQRRRIDELKRQRPDAVFVENPAAADMTADALAAAAKKAGVRPFTAPGAAHVSAAEGYVMIQAQKAGLLEIDFGTSGTVIDFLSKRPVGHGPRLTLPFNKGETRIFKVNPN